MADNTVPGVPQPTQADLERVQYALRTYGGPYGQYLATTFTAPQQSAPQQADGTNGGQQENAQEP